MARDFQSKCQEKRSREWGRGTEQVLSMQRWPEEKCHKRGGWEWDRGQRTPQTQAKTRISEDQKEGAGNLGMLLEAEPAFCPGSLNTTFFFSLFFTCTSFPSLPNPYSFLPLSSVLSQVYQWSLRLCLARNLAAFQKRGQASDPYPFLGAQVRGRMGGVEVEQLLKDQVCEKPSATSLGPNFALCAKTTAPFVAYTFFIFNCWWRKSRSLDSI